MSRIISSDKTENCQPWQAPSLGISSAADYDFKLSKVDDITHREQQEKIHQQSYEKSYAKGYMEGLAKGQQEIKQQVGHLQSLMSAITAPQPDLDNQVVDELAQLSMAVVRQMVRRELKTSPGEVVAVVREALSLLPVTATEVTLELHPEDAALIRSALMPAGTNSSWDIKDDALLTRGGCRVLTNTSRIDATVENRMNAIIAEVMGCERKTDDN